MSNKLSQALKFESIIVRCNTVCIMGDGDDDELVMPGRLVRRPPADACDLCVSGVGWSVSGDIGQPLRKVDIGKLAKTETIRKLRLSVRHNNICDDYLYISSNHTFKEI
jgi:hypothetical protein